MFLEQFSPLEFSSFFLSIPEGRNLKILTQGIHCLCTHAVQSNTFLKYLAVVFGTSIDLADHIDQLSQRYSTTIIPDGHFPVVQDKLNMLAMAHHVFINTIVHHLFEQHINAIVLAAPIAQLAYVHAWTKAYMLFPVKASDGVFVVFKYFGFLLLRHAAHLFKCKTYPIAIALVVKDN